MTTTKKILDYHLARLQNRDRQIRLKTIRQLALLGDPEALDALHEVYRSDPDAGVRNAALEAGRTIFAAHQARRKARP